MPIATGFDFEPLLDGNVLIQFFDDNGNTINKQIVTADVAHRLPLVAALLDVAITKGPEVAREIVEKVN